MGPEPPPSRSKRSRPEWVRILEEDAKVDEDVAQVSPIRGADFGKKTSTVAVAMRQSITVTAWQLDVCRILPVLDVQHDVRPEVLSAAGETSS